MTPSFTSEPSGEYPGSLSGWACSGQSQPSSLRGFWSGLAFLIGAAVSCLSFFGWRRLAGALGPGGKTRFAWLFVARNFILLAAAWVIIKFLGPNAVAGATGLFVATAAIILEIVYELIYAS